LHKRGVFFLESKEVYTNDKFKYLFVDEVQLAKDGYAEVLIRFHLKNPDEEIFVTGSNSQA
jgi:predicted AAA+ superfamily ATPase